MLSKQDKNKIQDKSKPHAMPFNWLWACECIKDDKSAKDGALEAENTSTNTQLVRESAGSQHIDWKLLSWKFREAGGTGSIDGTKFKAILLQEGLGNLKDGYYYTAQAIQDAVASGIFEGKKMYADHPSLIEEESRPERSVRDIIGHFENVTLAKDADGSAMIEADVVILPEEPFEWAKSLVSHAAQFTQKYPDKQFIGLSINASGEAESQDISEFMATQSIPSSAKAKLNTALQNGLSEVRVVSNINDAVSVDLVTEAGARGRIIKMLEADMAKKKLKEDDAQIEAVGTQENPKVDAGQVANAGGAKGAGTPQAQSDSADGSTGDGVAAHADAAQDEELIKKMLSKYLGDGGMDESAMKCAKHYMQAYKDMGHPVHEAMEMACKAMKASKHAKEAMDATATAEATEASGAIDDGVNNPGSGKINDGLKQGVTETHGDPTNRTFGDGGNVHIHVGAKESDDVIKLKGENSALKERLAKIEMDQYVDEKLRETGWTRKITDEFRKIVGSVKSKKDFDEKLKLFAEGRKSNTAGSESGELDFSDVTVMVEKEYPIIKEGSSDFSDCAE